MWIFAAATKNKNRTNVIFDEFCFSSFLTPEHLLHMLHTKCFVCCFNAECIGQIFLLYVYILQQSTKWDVRQNLNAAILPKIKNGIWGKCLQIYTIKYHTCLHMIFFSGCITQAFINGYVFSDKTCDRLAFGRKSVIFFTQSQKDAENTRCLLLCLYSNNLPSDYAKVIWIISNEGTWTL